MGDVAVETLRAGNLVMTSSGESRPVKWIGHRDIDLRARCDAHSFYPVRIAAGAFGADRPSKDLYVSVGRSICVDLCGEVLIPAGHLVNGSTIARVEMDDVSYWHVEFESHDILVANNLPAESYFVMENRSFFVETDGTLDALDDGLGRTHADFCRPVVLDGPLLAFVHQRLAERAEALGWTASLEADLRLLVDREVRRPLEEGKTAVFLFPAGAQDVRLLSSTFVPAALGHGDPRELGLRLCGLSFWTSQGERSVRFDDERLKDGVYAVEAQNGRAFRWTKGELVLDPELWSGLSGAVALLVVHDSAAVRRWVAPAITDTEVTSSKSAPRLRLVG
jgi:hypothetical protein